MNTLDAIEEGRREAAGNTSRPLTLTVSALLVFAACYLGAKFGLALTFEPYPISVLWPPNAILLAALLIAPLRWWPALLLAAFPAHLLAEIQDGVPTAMVLCWFVSNVSEALIGAAIVRLVIGAVPSLDALREVVVFIGSALIAAFLSSFLDAGFVVSVGRGTVGYWELWNTRLHSNVLASLVFVPVIVTWVTLLPAALQSITRVRVAEAALLACGLAAAASFAFGLPSAASTPPALLYLPLPFLLWAALRFGATGASAAFMLVALLVIWCAGHGRGPFAEGDPIANARAVQYFLVFIGATMLALAAIVQERKRAERELRRSESRFASAFRASPDAIAIVRKSDGKLMEANDRWHALFRHPREQYPDSARPGFRLYAHERGHVEVIELARERGRVNELEAPLQTRSGEEPQVVVSLEDLEIDGEACLIAIVRDVTDRKRAVEANERLAHVSRLAVMGELTASIAHEINQPLGAILSNADAAEMLLNSENVPLAELRHILDDIRRDDLRVADVVQHMRMLMRKRELTMEAFDLNRAVSDVLQLVSGDLARRRVTVMTRFAPLPIVRGDHVHIQQVVMNLILNALDAMSDNAGAGRRLDVITQRDGERVQVTVSDNGPGLKPEHLPRLFDSFFTTKEQGMGLGLSIARSIVEAHGGRIWAENGSWVGARFHFTLCITPGCGARPAAPGAAA